MNGTINTEESYEDFTTRNSYYLSPEFDRDDQLFTLIHNNKKETEKYISEMEDYKR